MLSKRTQIRGKWARGKRRKRTWAAGWGATKEKLVYSVLKMPLVCVLPVTVINHLFPDLHFPRLLSTFTI